MSNHSSKPVLRVGIVGGGISGVALALDLARNGNLDIQLFEAAPAFGEVGAGVAFGANSVRALDGLGIGDAYRKVEDRTPAPWDDVWFEWRYGEGEARHLATTLMPGVGQSSVHRADFLDVLTTHLPAGIAQFDKRAVGVEQNGNEARVMFADGTDYRCDLLIAADGVKSVIRNHVLKGIGAEPAEPRFTGTCAYRGMIDSETLREAYRAKGLDTHLVDVPQMYLAKDGHILTFPVKKGRIINVVAFLSDRSTDSPQWPATEPWVRKTTQAQMLNDFSGWGEAARTLLECIVEPTYWALHDLAELPGYVHNRVVLIGDAAHAMLPHQGAGAGQGLEDAYFLARLLGDPRLTPENLDAVLASYDALRRPRACKVQRTSTQAGELYEMRDPEAAADEKVLAAKLETRFDWLWQHDPATDVAEAHARLGWEHQLAAS
ncbi:salicylate hydroxylase [Pseudomonas sp. NFACC02]|uniref:salicylate 1-monooxygenase n=1 Tax=Pseudomonas sp. NFACC02 TaxID=1566250 RepID=UPI0008B1545E|nr:salicylate 1-monooxygenase [Pseudomonas sp. NFACC02]SER73275.1 salicylate hydroxylase [Pseudomonas sp. NFACC02]